jgi:hypothetical protein
MKDLTRSRGLVEQAQNAVRLAKVDVNIVPIYEDDSAEARAMRQFAADATEALDKALYNLNAMQELLK